MYGILADREVDHTHTFLPLAGGFSQPACPFRGLLSYLGSKRLEIPSLKCLPRYPFVKIQIGSGDLSAALKPKQKQLLKCYPEQLASGFKARIRLSVVSPVVLQVAVNRQKSLEKVACQTTSM